MEPILTDQDLLKHIRKKKRVLSRVARELKSHFVGLDNIIDRIIKSVEVWYILPQLLSRPSVICLWGPTGVGKTDLVRRFVKAIDFYDRFCEIELSSKGNSSNYNWLTSISSILAQNQNIESGKQAIILLDEIQNFRTISDEGMEITDYYFKDIWGLLSDGKLPFKPDMDYLLSAVHRTKQKKNKKILIKKNHIPFKTITNIFRPTSSKVVPAEDEEEPKLLTDDKQIKVDLEEDMEDEEDGFLSSSDYYSLKRFKSLLRLKEPIEEISGWTEEKKRSILLKCLNDPKMYEEEDYRRSLIFISGNLDEAYKFSKRSDDVDTEADTFHELSKKVTIIDIKIALGARFRPEQIARFGNNHIIYPSLSKKSYEEIISRKIDEIEKNTFENFKIKIKVQKSMIDFIYKNGVFPAQGTRPVFSSISEILESHLPTILMESIIKKKNNITIGYEGVHIVSRHGNELLKQINYLGTIDKLRTTKNKNVNRKILSAVHESGHALIYALLTGFAPPEFVVTPASDEVEGYVLLHSICGSKKSSLEKIMVLLAGSEAEKIVFGDLYYTSGSASDLSTATSLAGEMVRNYNMDEFSSFIISQFHQKGSLANNNMEDSGKRIEYIIQKQREATRAKIIENKDLFISIVDSLVNRDKIMPKEFKEICSKKGINLKVINGFEISYHNYFEIYNEFKK